MDAKQTLQIASINVRGLRDALKRRSIFNSLANLKYDIIFVQETHGINSDIDSWGKEWEGKTCFSMFSTREAGVAILFRASLDLEIKKTTSTPDGRVIQAQTVFMDQPLNLVNVYAPSGAMNVDRRREFFDSLSNYIDTDDDTCVNVLGGDFNCIVNSALDCNSRNYSDPTSKQLNNKAETLGLSDIYRVFHPNSKGFTFLSSTGSQSRIDRFYLDSNKLNHVLATDIEPFPMAPDHNMITVTLSFGNVSRGRGCWKLNTSLLTDQAFNAKIRNFWSDWRNRKPDFPSLLDWWDTGKSKLREICISHSRARSRAIKQHKRILQKQLRNTLKKLETRHSDGDVKRFHNLKEKLRDIEMKETRGKMIRARVQWQEEGERCTAYFANLEKSRGNQTLIRAIKRQDGTVTDNIYQILDEHVQFYKDLYTAEPTDTNKQDDILRLLENTLTEDAKYICEGEITPLECTKAVKSFARNKSPGTDGFPAEFYQHFWDILGSDFVEMANACYAAGSLAPSQRIALISTIFKKGDRLDIANWRPISLCNLDYKIITKVLSLRLVEVLGDIISSDQTCCIKGRNIGHNLLLIKDLIQYSNDENIPAIFLSIDQMKAFDRVDWSYLFKCLEAFGFGPSFIKWIRTIYNDISSCVKVNGFISAPFSLTRGVRQGCSLSALLYVLIAETFACLIRKDPNIRGIPLPKANEISVISQYADDTNLTLSDMESVKRCFNLLDVYGSASGARINLSKCEGLLSGSMRNRIALTSDVQIKWTSDKIKVLGLWVGNSDTDRENWSNKIEKFCKTLKTWSRRDLSLRGKVVVVNQLSASALWYIASVIVMPSWVVKSLETALWQFFWGSSYFPVKKDVCRLPVNLGGQGVVDFIKQSYALKLKWIKSLLSGDLSIKWRHLAFHFLGKYAGSNLGARIFDLNLSPYGFQVLLPFYKELLATWNSLEVRTRQEPDVWSIDQILEAPLFDNPLIRDPHTGKTINHKHWIQNNILFVKDITYQFVAGFLPCEAIRELFQTPPSVARLDREVSTILRSLPTTWRRRIETAQPGLTSAELEYGFRDNNSRIFQPILKQKNKFFYVKLSNNINVIKSTWNNVPLNDFYKQNYAKCIDNKVADLCWKIIHSGLTTAVKLHKWRMIPDSHCRSCDRRVVENTQHLFWLCPIAKRLWDFVAGLARQFGFTEPLSYVSVVTMAPQSSYADILLFYFITIGKYSLWKYRCAYFYNDENKPPDIVLFFKKQLIWYIRRDYEILLTRNNSPNNFIWAHQGLLCNIVSGKLIINL